MKEQFPLQQQDTLNRYLLFFYSKDVIADVHSFIATEALSTPYRYTIRFTSKESNIPVERILNHCAEFHIREPNPKAAWHGQTPWLPVRRVNGTITSLARIKSSADEAFYECVLEHELSLLNRNYRSAVYMNLSVPELVKKLMTDSGYFEGFNIDFDKLSHHYPRREMVIQWKETDLQFIQRLLAEVGIFFRFENHEKVQSEVVVIFGDSSGQYVFCDRAIPYVRRSGMTSYNEYITDLEEKHTLVSGSALVRSYNYRIPFSPQKNKAIASHDIPEGITCGQEYHYADPFREEGDLFGDETETAAFYARVRHERLLNEQCLLSATTSDPVLIPGTVFTPGGPVPQSFTRGLVVTRLTITGSRSEYYQSVINGIPYVDGYSYRPAYSSRPVITGTVPARIASLGSNKTYAGIDAQGRYRVKFDFDLAEKREGFESALIRLGRPYGGETYGFHFPLLNGTEVAVSFEGGDPDRPFIAHVLHNGRAPDLVTNSNNTRNVIRTAGLNKIRLEDKRGQEHIKISTEHGKSQLSVGNLVDAQGKPRGEGIEGRTDDRIALRGGKGVLITTEPQPRAQGKQLDMAAAITQLEKALSIANTLQQCAAAAGASETETASQHELKAMLDKLTGAGLLSYADQGQAHVTPQTLQLSAGNDLVATAGNNGSVNIVKKLSVAAGEKFSLFVRKLGIQLIASKGDITTQAQRGAVHLFSQQDFTLMSSEGRMNGSAKKGIQLSCGGGGIRINPNGLVEIFSPTGVEIKAPGFKYDGPESVQVQAPAFKEGTFQKRYQLQTDGQPIANQKFKLTSSSGQVTEGMTDSNGNSPLLDATDLDTYIMELVE
ncbi:type VI secretion system Vgr family protein [Enterobacter oligotrophicus]|uniref:type VI secretion system Vgr family protein n=1 Tax=Enterobacter oligotrophicus TaxID=2478464 RepID=UPI001260FD91|nr:type VI secretion system tip protein VgrG [Enterobacter oligotrophicus]